MLQEFIYAIFLGLVLIGVVYLLNQLMLKLISPIRERPMFLVVPLGAEENSPDLTLRAAYLRAQSLHKPGSIRIVAYDCGMTEKSKLLCAQTVRDMPEIILCNPDNLMELFGPPAHSRDTQNKSIL